MFNFTFSWKTKLIGIAALSITCFAGGMRVEHWRTMAHLARSIAEVEKTRQIDAKSEAKIVDTNEKQKEVIRYVYKTIYQKAEQVGDADHVCFTHDSLSLWNDSIAAANRDRSEPAAKVETADPARNEQYVATVEQVLKNASDNFERCALNAQDHDALIDRINSLKDKMCYCAN